MCLLACRDRRITLSGIAPLLNRLSHRAPTSWIERLEPRDRLGGDGVVTVAHVRDGVGLRTGTSVTDVGTGAVVDDVGTVGNECDGVVAGAAGDGVVAGAAGDSVVAVAGVDGVVAGAAGDGVVASATVDVIVALRTGGDDVIAGAAGDDVVAVEGGDGVVALAAIDHVVELRAGDGVVAIEAIDRPARVGHAAVDGVSTASSGHRRSVLRPANDDVHGTRVGVGGIGVLVGGTGVFVGGHRRMVGGTGVGMVQPVPGAGTKSLPTSSCPALYPDFDQSRVTSCCFKCAATALVLIVICTYGFVADPVR